MASEGSRHEKRPRLPLVSRQAWGPLEQSQRPAGPDVHWRLTPALLQAGTRCRPVKGPIGDAGSWFHAPRGLPGTGRLRSLNGTTAIRRRSPVSAGYDVHRSFGCLVSMICLRPGLPARSHRPTGWRPESSATSRSRCGWASAAILGRRGVSGHRPQGTNCRCPAIEPSGRADRPGHQLMNLEPACPSHGPTGIPEAPDSPGAIHIRRLRVGGEARPGAVMGRRYGPLSRCRSPTAGMRDRSSPVIRVRVARSAWPGRRPA